MLWALSIFAWGVFYYIFLTNKYNHYIALYQTVIFPVLNKQQNNNSQVSNNITEHILKGYSFSYQGLSVTPYMHISHSSEQRFLPILILHSFKSPSALHLFLAMEVIFRCQLNARSCKLIQKSRLHLLLKELTVFSKTQQCFFFREFQSTFYILNLQNAE